MQKVSKFYVEKGIYRNKLESAIFDMQICTLQS